jgi:hypothetical protein
MDEKSRDTDVQDEGQLRSGLKLIKMMKGDIITSMKTGQQLIIQGDALGALLTVVQIAEEATLLKLAKSRESKSRIRLPGQ